MVKIILLTGVLLLSVTQAIGLDESKAIMDASREKGILLSTLARKNIGIKTTKFQTDQPMNLPESAVVHTKDLVGIYVERAGWFKFQEVTVTAKRNNTVTVVPKGLLSTEVVVLEGAALLRVSEMEAFTSEE